MCASSRDDRCKRADLKTPQNAGRTHGNQLQLILVGPEWVSKPCRTLRWNGIPWGAPARAAPDEGGFWCAGSASAKNEGLQAAALYNTPYSI
jgi:hypothetical protein